LFEDRESVVVFGAGGHAKVVLATIEAEAKYRITGLLDDDEGKHGKFVLGYGVLGGRSELEKLRKENVSGAVVAVGNNRFRAEIAECLERKGFELLSAIHPSASIIRGACLGKGAVVLPFAHIGADAVIGDGCILSVGSVIGHDCELGSWGHLAPGAKLAGNVRIGRFGFVGMNAVVLPGLQLGSEVVIGANAVVVNDLSSGVTAFGVPARIQGET